MVGRRKKKCGKCDNCLSGRWERKCQNPSAATKEDGQTLNDKVDERLATPPKRLCAVKATNQFPKTKSLPKGNNQKGYWARKPSIKIKPSRENKRKQVPLKSSEDTLVLKTPRNKTTSKRQVIDCFDFFGISYELSERLKNKLFFRTHSPSQMSKGRKSELIKIAKALVFGVLGLIHPKPQRLVEVLFDKNKNKSSGNEIGLKQMVQQSVTFQRVAEQYKNATSREEKDRFLSILKPDLTRLELCELLGENITWKIHLPKKKIHLQKISHLQEIRGKSNQKCCPKCYRDFKYQSNLNKHLAANNCHPTKTALRKNRAVKQKMTFGENLKDVVLEKMKADTFITKATLVKPDLTRGEEKEDYSRLIANKKCVYKLINGSSWEAGPKLFHAGFARKWNIRGAFRYSDDQKEFIEWCFNYGVRYPKKKLKPDVAANLMRIFGTKKAELMYPDEDFMKQNEAGKASFKWKDFVSRYEMKSYFGRLQQEKKKKASLAQAKGGK